MISLTINGVRVQVEAGTTLLEAARFAGFSIPTLCHARGHLALGSCRLCVVEIGEGARRRLVSSCSYRAAEGLEVWTSTERVEHARRVIAELILASYPQVAEVREVTASLGVIRQRFREDLEPWLAPLGPATSH